MKRFRFMLLFIALLFGCYMGGHTYWKEWDHTTFNKTESTNEFTMGLPITKDDLNVEDIMAMNATEFSSREDKEGIIHQIWAVRPSGDMAKGF